MYECVIMLMNNNKYERCKMGKYIDLTGRQFGEIEVIKDTNERHKNGSHIWECKCSCGKVLYLPTSVLKNQKSCGCKAKRLEDLSGKKFGRLTVISMNHDTKDKRVRWNCICDCGNKAVVRACNLKSGEVKSCGCLANANNKTHGMSKTRLYTEWANMKYRCYYSRNSSFENYGGRGIKVCNEWKDNFQAFYDWAMENGYKDNLTIERKDTNGDYCPENCCWIPASEQANNRRMNLQIEYNGKTQNLKQWCNELNLDYKRTHNRIFKLGYSFEEAITKPVMKQRRSKKARKLYGNNE